MIDLTKISWVLSRVSSAKVKGTREVAVERVARIVFMSVVLLLLAILVSPAQGQQATEITIDIYPNRTPNRVDLSRNYTIYVAVLGSADFDVTTLNSSTVKFGRTGTEAGPVRAPIIRDIVQPLDGYPDAMYGFRTFDCGFQPGDTRGCLTGQTTAGVIVSSCDSVLVIGDVTNNTPTIISTPGTAASEGVLYSYDADATDPDGDPLAYALTTSPAGMTIDASTGLVQWTPSATQAGSHNVTVEVSDGRGGVGNQSYAIIVAEAVNTAPTFTSTAVTAGTEGALYSYDADATDPDGDPLAYALTTSPAGMTINGSTGLIQWTPSGTQAGTHPVTVDVSDGRGGADSQSYAIIVAEAVNTAPTFTSTAVTAGTEGALYSYDADATDPDGDPLAYALTTSPAGMTINGSTGLIQWTPSGTQAGTHPVTVDVSDGRGGSDSQSYAISVAEGVNAAPTITSTPGTAGTEGALYSYDADATDPDGDPLTYVLTTSPVGMTIDASTGLVQWTPTNAQVGDNSVSVRVEDTGGLFDTQSFTIDVAAAEGPDHIRPEVDVTVSPAEAYVGEPVTITVAATDNVGVVVMELRIDGTWVALGAGGTATYSSATPGVFTAVGSAWDIAGNSGEDSAEFRFLVPGDTTAPTVAITAPAEHTKLSEPADIIGTASDDNLVRYVLEYSPKDRNEYVTFARGTSSVTGDVLGALDPTQMRNGLYDIKLTAEDQSGNVASTTTTYQAEGEMKVGNFTMSFDDLTIPVAGIPITITRTYDSRVKSKGDFGVGWTLDVKDIELSESCVMGENWTQTSSGGIFTTYYLQQTEPHTVTVTFPDGRTDEFNVQIDPSSSLLIPVMWLNSASFTAAPGTLSSLTQDEQPAYYSGGQILDWGFEVYDPDRYTLTTKEGDVYVINQPVGLQSIRDRNGNTITFNANGIIHSAGKSVVFAKDAQGRITTITDPLGNVIRYQYDYYGDLVAVVDQESNKTTFKYNSAHGLVDIIDPRGVGVARNIYDNDGRLIAIEDADGNRVEFTHNVGTRQEVVRDRLGNVTVYDYDEDGNVLAETDALGNMKAYTYDARGNKLSETDPLGNTTQHTYDARDNILSQTDPLGNTTAYTYNANGEVLTSTDSLGNVTINTYDASGNLASTTDPLGNATTCTYDAAGNTLTETDPLGNTTQYTYDASGNIVSQTDPLGNVTTYTYDGNGNRLTETRTRTTWTGVETLTTQYEYDGKNRLVQTTDALGSVSRTEYNAIDKESARVDELGRRTEYEYDTRGNLIRTTYADATEETSTYDAENRKISSTDRAGRTTQYEYDGVDNLIRTVFPDGALVQSIHDAARRMVQRIDQRGYITTYEYDAAGRNAAVTDALGNRTQFAYDCVGNRTGMTDANGNVTQYEYEALNRLFRTTYPDGTAVVVTYDAAGRKIGETDQAGNTTQFAYDAMGRLSQVTDALGNVTQYAYDEVGNRLTQTDANGSTTQFAYDALGRQIGRRLPLGQTETMSYDAVGNMVSKTDFNGDTTTYSYGVCCNRLLGKLFPDGSWVSFTYTATGRRATESKSTGETTAYIYDALDRLLSRTDPDGTTILYTYDAASNRTSVTTSVGATIYAYDALNRLATVTDLDGGVTTYAYDAVGNRASVAYPNAIVAQYTYDSLNRLTNLLNHTSAGATISSYAYTLGPAGNRTRVVEDTGRTVDYTYDAVYRLVSERITDGATGTTIDYTYDPVGNRLTKTVPTATGTATTTYLYDNNDRLLTETVVVAKLMMPESGTRYAYASIGRPSAAAPYIRDGFMWLSFLGLVVPLAITWVISPRQGKQARRQQACISALCVFLIPMFVLSADNVWAINRQAIVYEAMTAAGLTQLPVPTSHTYTHDNNGNTISRANGVGTDTYTYDYENRLTSANIQLGSTPGPVSYAYDADGIRTSKTTGGSTTSYTVDKNRPFAQVLVETTGATAVSYVHGDDLISMKRPTGTRYYHYDGQMSTRKLTDPTQTATDSYTYDAFGIELDHTGATVNDYKYTGEQYDSNMGFYYLRARYYDQGTGRFVTMDPFPGSVFDPISLHRYAYAHSSPIDSIDPSGCFALLAFSFSFSLSTLYRVILWVVVLAIVYIIAAQIEMHSAVSTWDMERTADGRPADSCQFDAMQHCIGGGVAAIRFNAVIARQLGSLQEFLHRLMGEGDSPRDRRNNDHGIACGSGRRTTTGVVNCCERKLDSGVLDTGFDPWETTECH